MYSILGTIVLNFQYIFLNRHFNCLFACPNTFVGRKKTFLNPEVFFMGHIHHITLYQRTSPVVNLKLLGSTE